ncbi:MAG: DegT/DnrJ/EryC1/StrS family aminotransferase [Candidatus Acidiferrales bacterium]
MPTQSMQAIPMLDLKAQYASIRDEIRAAIDEVLAAQHFILGPQVKAFEQEMAAYCGTKFAVGVASGTDALILALHACGVGPGDEVIVPTFSYIATADSASLLGAVPVFVDIDAATFNMNAAQLEARITPKTKAIVPVHLYGQPAEMDAILEIARRYNIKVIEDNAQAIGATYNGRKTGSMGDIGCISFFPSKNLGGYGDGGMVVTNSPELADRLRALRAHGAKRHKYLSDEQGWNSRLDELQAAILRVKLRHLDEWKRGRQQVAARYNQLFQGTVGVVTPKVAPGCEHVYHQYTIRVRDRDAVQQRVAHRGVPSTVYYPLPMHLQRMYASLGGQRGMLPVAERAADEVLSLPVYPELTAAQIARVADALAAAVKA